MQILNYRRFPTVVWEDGCFLFTHFFSRNWKVEMDSITGCSTLCLSLICSLSKVYTGTGHEGPGREQTYSCTLSLTSTLHRGGWPTPHRDRFTSGKDPVHMVPGGGVGPTVWTGAENLASTPGFDPRTVQVVASHCTDWAVIWYDIFNCSWVATRWQ
jgi:hypothetical protein